MTKLSDILTDALFTGRSMGYLAFRFWGPVCEGSRKSEVERQLGDTMAHVVNAPYRAAGQSGNYFFWHTLNTVMDDIYACENPERRERFVQLEKDIRGW
ncbi:hypothetical protein [Pantoea eucrina]|uniref:hypothetical protein n=1 Tax=Pantoea eucrina TaxID=472693 RepID=UPI00080F3B40|nr:hypothetical protein [Pantoea eucrina]